MSPKKVWVLNAEHSYIPWGLVELPKTKDVLRVYVEFGANLEAQDNGQLTALLWAAVNGNEGDWGESCATNWTTFIHHKC